MQTKEYRTVDKSGWARGPWDAECDKKQWQDEATGLPCLIVRTPMGHLCGYVGVPKEHPAHGVEYYVRTTDADGNERDLLPHELAINDIRVHGGLTYGRGCADQHTREHWEEFRASFPRMQAEAAKYPQGDSARYIEDWGRFLDDYDGWRTQYAARAICHIVDPGEADNVWWLGFDCAHLGDFSPAMTRHEGRSFRDGDYRDFAYVTAEVELLARQLAAIPQATRGVT